MHVQFDLQCAEGNQLVPLNSSLDAIAVSRAFVKTCTVFLGIWKAGD